MNDKNFVFRNEISTLCREYNEELARLIKSTISPRALKEKLSDYHENDIADILDELDFDTRNRLYRVMDAQDLADVLEYSENTAQYLNELSLRKRIEVLACMDTTDTVDYLKELDKEKRNLLLQLSSEDIQQDVALLLSYDEDEIGSIMSTNYIEIAAGLKIKDAMNSLIEQAAENDNISTLYVVDENGVFYGAIDLKDLIIARENTPLIDVITTQYPYVYAHEKIDDCVEQIKKYSEDSIPVLDENNKLLGVITAQDFIQVVDDEMGEDYAMLAGLSSEEDINEPLLRSICKRLPWLFTLLGLGLIISSIVGMFEKVVAELTLVMCFQTLILDMAGNSGTQSLAVTIRVLADENLSGAEKLKLVWKEARVGLVNGLIVGAVSCGVVGLYLHFVKALPMDMSYIIAGCIGVAMLCAMMLSSVVGTVVPLFFKKIHIDPAVASGPLITTINDLVAIVTYYGLTWIFLVNMLKL